MANTQFLPASLRQTVDRELKAGETIRWIEQPIARFFTPTTTSIFMTGLLSLGVFGYFTYSWINTVPRGPQAPDAFTGFVFTSGLLIGGLCLLMCVVPLAVPLLNWHEARQTVYLITDQRAVIVKGGSKTTIHSYDPNQMNEIFRKERPNGTGDVIFGVRQYLDYDGDPRTEEVGFKDICDSKAVEALLRALK